MRDWIRVLLVEDVQDSTAGRRSSGIESSGKASAAMAFVLETLFGTLDVDNQPLWEITIAVLLASSTATTLTSLPTSMSVLPRAVGMWAAPERAKVALLEATRKVWSSAEEIKLGSESRRLCEYSHHLHLGLLRPLLTSFPERRSPRLDFAPSAPGRLAPGPPLGHHRPLPLSRFSGSRLESPLARRAPHSPPRDARRRNRVEPDGRSERECQAARVRGRDLGGRGLCEGDGSDAACFVVECREARRRGKLARRAAVSVLAKYSNLRR